MSIKGKVISASLVSFITGTGLGVFVCVSALAIVIDKNKEATQTFINSAIEKFVYGDDKGRISKPRVKYASGPSQPIRYDEPTKEEQ